MDVASILPSPSDPVSQADRLPAPPRWRPTPGQVRAACIATKFAIILCFLAYIFRTAGAIERAREAERASPRTPVEFRHVMQRYHEYKSGVSLSHVIPYMGPPTKRFVQEPEFAEVEERGWNSGRSLLPQHYDWDQWIDPANPDRWVAVGYIGKDADRKSWAVVKKGFSIN